MKDDIVAKILGHKINKSPSKQSKPSKLVQQATRTNELPSGWEYMRLSRKAQPGTIRASSARRRMFESVEKFCERAKLA